MIGYTSLCMVWCRNLPILLPEYLDGIHICRDVKVCKFRLEHQYFAAIFRNTITLRVICYSLTQIDLAVVNFMEYIPQNQNGINKFVTCCFEKITFKNCLVICSIAVVIFITYKPWLTYTLSVHKGLFQAQTCKFTIALVNVPTKP